MSDMIYRQLVLDRINKQMDEMIVRFHEDERGIATSWDEVGKLVRCKDCVHCADDWNGNQPMFTCELGIYDGSVCPYYFCSMAELRGKQDE